MKKKICLISIIGLALLSGCSKGYKEGVYTGTAIDSYGGQNNTATAIVTVDKNGKITGYNINIQKMKKISANSYRTVVSIVKNYNKKMKYIGMTKNVYNTHTTYYYNAKNKLVKYMKDVYVPNTNTIMGYDEYDGNGKLVRSVRW